MVVHRTVGDGSATSSVRSMVYYTNLSACALNASCPTPAHPAYQSRTPSADKESKDLKTARLAVAQLSTASMGKVMPRLVCRLHWEGKPLLARQDLYVEPSWHLTMF